MAFSNQVVFANTNDREGWDGLVGEICYADLFRVNPWDGGQPKPKKFVLTAFRIDKDMSHLRANWWAKNILEVCPPELLGGFTISRIRPHVLSRVKNIFDNGRGWVEVVIDGSILSGNEIYCLLSLFRYPQEQTLVVKRTAAIMKEYGLPFDQAFLFAGSADNHSGHGMICTSTWVDMKNKPIEVGRKIIDNYSLKEVMREVVDTRGLASTYLRNVGKEQINKFFTPKGLKYHSWGSGHALVEFRDPEPKVGHIPKYWLDKFGYTPKGDA